MTRFPQALEAGLRWDPPVGLCCFERCGFKAHGAEVVVLAVVNVGHGLILQPVRQLDQRAFG